MKKRYLLNNKRKQKQLNISISNICSANEMTITNRTRTGVGASLLRRCNPQTLAEKESEDNIILPQYLGARSQTTRASKYYFNMKMNECKMTGNS